MKKTLSLILICGFIGCKPTRESITNFDMTAFCKDYIVLVYPDNITLYVFIDRNNPDMRFVIWKDLDFQGSGYGFCYSYFPGSDGVLKNGVYTTANEAIQAARDNIKKQKGRPFWLSQFVKWDKNKWMTTGADIMTELCP